MSMTFTVEMLKRAVLRRSRTDQIDRHVISLASGKSYSDLGNMLQRDYNALLDELRIEVIPLMVRVSWDDAVSQWTVRECECECECDECSFIVDCGFCKCSRPLVCSFREVYQNDIERISVSGTPDYLKLVELVTGADIREWRLKKYKTVEMAVARTMRSPLPGMLS